MGISLAGATSCIQSGFEPDFNLLKVPDEDARVFIQRVSLIATGCTSRLPSSFFNLTKVISSYSRLNDVRFKEAQEQVLKNPKLVFHFNNIDIRANEKKLPAKFLQFALHEKFPELKKKSANFFHPNNIEFSALSAIKETGLPVTARLGQIRHGPLKNSGITWQFLDEAFRCGALGLNETGCMSLKDFLVSRKVIKPTPDAGEMQPKKEFKLFSPRPSVKPAYIPLHEVESSARAMVFATGKRPETHAKKIEHGPLAGRTTWNQIHYLFAQSSPRLEASPFKSLADFLDNRRIFSLPETNIKLSLRYKDIAESARETYLATNRRPTAEDGIVQFGPLKGEETWSGIHQALRHGHRGLLPETFSGLPEFLDQFGIEGQIANPGNVRGSRYRLSDIAIALRLTYLIERHRLTKNDGVMKYGPLAGEKCNAVDDAFKRGNRGLKGCGFESLTAFADHLQIPHDPHHASSITSRLKKARFTLEDAEESFNLHIAQDQKIPTADNRLITLGPLGKLSLTFAAANICIARQKDIHGYSGMKALIEDRCAETAFWHAPTSKLAKEFINSAGVNYDLARHVASLDVGRLFMGPPAWLFKKEMTEEKLRAPALAHDMK